MEIAKFRVFVLWLVVAVALVVAAFLGYKMYSAHHPTAHKEHADQDHLAPLKAASHAESAPAQIDQVSLPASHLGTQHKTPSFIYPSIEKKIDIEFLDNAQTRKLLVKNLDSYKLFCLHEVLKAEHIEFALDKKKTHTTLIIYLPHATKRFLEDLKYYQIPYQLD
ncbi:hypothetical protein [Helicobacter ailurogastricus]|uniref:hypothetical protein n=1 Tax=Helicobacter ailurogastricus TaxID=1578720 RepID=UPI0022C7537C|nr:hypothetical protein [Helicobacter ailurogastricus]GLH57271.1 hypothetical protein NHP214376_00570 [Helicobacter ailurogastricus]GLH59196.1 hypothetical protein NHP214377_04620 [Helicobacter ailurogastricus]